MRHPAISEEPDYSAWDDADPIPPTAAGADDLEPFELVVQGADAGERLDKWLAAQLPQFSRSRLQQWIADGAVSVNDGPAATRQPVWEADVIIVIPHRLPDESAFIAEDLPLDIVDEDTSLLVVNKPVGLVVHPAAGNWTGTLLNALLFRFPLLAAVPRAGIVHRLDKDTSGLMVVAKTVEAQTNLVRQLQARTVGREYLALVHGRPPARGMINEPIGRHPRDRVRMAVHKPGGATAKAAITHFTVLERSADTPYGEIALVCCRLETGRTHQIRVHMEWLGFPLLGDLVYRGARPAADFGHQALHAWRLGLDDPIDLRGRQWQVEPPAEFRALASRCNITRWDGFVG